MKSNYILTTTVATVATTSITLLMFWPFEITAKDTSTENSIQLTPEINIDGVTLAMLKPDATTKPGQLPEIKIKAINTTDKKITVEATVAMHQTTSNLRSRVMPMPKEIWKKPCTITLKPNETRMVTIATGLTARTDAKKSTDDNAKTTLARIPETITTTDFVLRAGDKAISLGRGGMIGLLRTVKPAQLTQSK